VAVLRDLPRGLPVTVAVAPEQADAVAAALRELEPSRAVRVEPDAATAAGGFRLETPAGEWDGSLDGQLAAIREELEVTLGERLPVA
ncbi:MAG: hypothetical protein IRY95_07845, partial [Clostridia bacterium]|nr:hypothetical protein [Clostridia bacterium]